MDSIRVRGGVPLQGRVRIQGSKNAALPILAASILTRDVSYIWNCPRISDVYNMMNILESLGCLVRRQGDGIRVDTKNIICGSMPEEAVKGMRSSLCLLGALIGACRHAVLEYPGGCVIGDRPIDLHIEALSKMGVSFDEKEGRLYADAPNLSGADINLRIPSVGATENIILAAVFADGITRIENAAKEPEIVALCAFLNECGADIRNAGGFCIEIHGVKKLHGVHYRIPADRIVAGTYLFGCVCVGGNILLEDAPSEHMQEVVNIAEKMGSRCDITDEGIYVQSFGRPVLPAKISTSPYPGFPTDLQSIVLASMLRGEGECIIEENIFENRFRVIEPLKKMGADIEALDAKRIRVRGVESLAGAEMEACELRGGAALVIAGLCADEDSLIGGSSYIYRGYENICRDLRELGARIVGV